MAQTLTVCRAGLDWAFRDVTGALYNQSPDIGNVIEAAQDMALRAGCQVTLSADAEQQLRLAMPPSEVDSTKPEETNFSPRLLGFWERLIRAR